MVENIDAHEKLWAEEEALLTASEMALENGEVVIEETTNVDLAVVRVPGDWPDRPAHRFTQHRQVAIHPMAVHNRTRCNRIVTHCGDRLRFDCRNESWVQVVHDRPLLRVDLAPLADSLSQAEGGKVTCQVEVVDQFTPSQVPEGGVSSLSPDQFVDAVALALRQGTTAWKPYDPVP